MKTISYGVTVCNEITEIAVLVDTLKEKLREGDEIVIQYDEGSVTDVVMEYLNIMKNGTKILLRLLDSHLIKISQLTKIILNHIVKEIIYFRLMQMKYQMNIY